MLTWTKTHFARGMEMKGQNSTPSPMSYGFIVHRASSTHGRRICKQVQWALSRQEPGPWPIAIGIPNE
jgi:hypothetical protein